MQKSNALSQTISLGIVLRRARGVTRWVPWVWTAVAVLPGAGPAAWRVMRSAEGVTEYHAATVDLTLYRSDTEAYRVALSDKPPSVYVILREAAPTVQDCPIEVALATASPYEAQDYADTGEEIVEKVPMPAGLAAWIGDFVADHHADEVFVKRKRDKKRIDTVQDGIGDPRVAKPADIYASPALTKRRLQ